MTDPQQNPQNTGGTPVPPPPTPPKPAGVPQGGTPPPPKATPPPPPPAQPPAGYGQQQGQQGGYMPPPQQGGGMGYPPMPPQGGGYPQYADPYGYQQMPPQQGGGYPQPPYGYPPQGYAPQGGYMPPPQGGGMGYPPMPQGGGYPPMPGGMPGAPGGMPPEDMTPANFQLGTKLPRVLKVKCPPHGLKFDEEKFIRLLAGSISLAKDEKKKIVESVPKLKQEQIDELIKIFEEEKQKFAALSKKHVPQLEKLADQHYTEWMQLEGEMEQEGKKKVDQQKADEIRKNLGL